MTRINCIPVRELTDAHLGAEYRELPRVFKLVLAAHRRGETPDDPRNPKQYVLGPGHVRFFYPKLGYIGMRFYDIVEECKRRNRATSFEEVPHVAAAIPIEWWGEWQPTKEAMRLNRARIAERLEGNL